MKTVFFFIYHRIQPFLAREMIIKINFQTLGYSNFSEGHSDRTVQATDFLHN